MRSRLTFVVLAIVIAAACSGSQVATPGDPAPVNAIRDKYIAAYNAGDAAAVAALFAEDAVSMPDHRAALVGRAAIESYFRDVFMQFSASVSVTPGETDVTGDVAHEHGTFSVTLTPKAGGSATTETGNYLVVLKKGSDGNWLVHHDIDNSNVPHPAPAPTPAPAEAK
jgi:uncharacterized protein (TIGR02246 family)